jgi:hypothetical protein
MLAGGGCEWIESQPPRSKRDPSGKRRVLHPVYERAESRNGQMGSAGDGL